MAVSWSMLTFTPADEVIETITESWGWLLCQPYTPLLFSALGDMFFQFDSESVYWLNTGVGEITKVAESVDEFNQKLNTDIAEEWFLPSLVEDLYLAGKPLKLGQCYTFVIQPIFAECKYEVFNINPVDAKEHFGLTGDIHRQIQELPDGASVKFTVV